VTVTFRVSAYFLPDYEGQNVSPSITFRNLIWNGIDGTGSGFTEADVESFSQSELSNDNTQTWGTLNPGVGQYLVLAFPANYTQLNGGNDYEDDGVSDFLHGGVTCAMLDAHETVSITNTAGYVENYDVWASTVADLASGSFVTSTSSTINYINYGVLAQASGFTEASVEDSLATSTASNDKTTTFSVTATGGEYIAFAWPVRLGLVTFWVGGFEGGFESPETVSVTNKNGWSEDYYMARSTNAGLGLTSVETKDP